MSGNIIIIGPPAAGKSTLGRRLSERMGLAYFDVDREIEDYLGVNIDTIFAKEGEDGFRCRETKMLKTLLTEHSGAIIATGGGCILAEENRKYIRAQALVVYLDVNLTTQVARVSRDSRRPLLNLENVRDKLIEQRGIRTPLYESLADLTFHSDRMSLKKVSTEIESYLVHNDLKLKNGSN